MNETINKNLLIIQNNISEMNKNEAYINQLLTTIKEQKIQIQNQKEAQTKKLDSTTYVLYVLMDLASSDWEKEVFKRKKKQNYYNEHELIKIIKKLFCKLKIIIIIHFNIK